MKPKNLLIIMVDELAASAVGCYGNPVVKTPNIDQLANRGVTFTNCYATSPICVPARAAFATGRYPHETGYWDNVFAYDGKVKSWGHVLQEHGHRATSIGKLHYVDGSCSSGFDEQINPMHLFGGGDIFGLEREDPPSRPQSATLAAEVAAGDSGYTRYDKDITRLTEEWFANRLNDQGDKPWVLFTSYIAPHFPLTVPQKYLDLYDDDDFELLGKSLNDEGPLREWWSLFRGGYNFDDYFNDDNERRRALKHYYALCSFADENVGRVVAALEASEAARDTAILFMADHGDNMGARGLWGKSTMYEESANVPMILVDPQLEAASICKTPVSTIDVFPTVLDAVGISPEMPSGRPGSLSLFDVASSPFDDQRLVFSEYHASCAPTGLFMLRKGAYKFIHYTGAGSELYDLESDPEETRDLSAVPAYGDLLKQFEADLRDIVSPEEVDRRAKLAQRKRLAELGGMATIVNQGGVPHTPAPGEEPEFIGT